MSTLKIFLSCGSTYTEEQRVFLKSLEDFLLRNGCRPHTIGHNVYTANQPVMRARDEIKTCDGAIILAFTRYQIEKGTDSPGSAKVQPIDGYKLPTVWNQLEGGMAYGLDLPLLILIENGLKQQGIVSDRSEWFPQHIELLPTVLEGQAFNGVFHDWRRKAADRATLREREVQRLVAGLTMMDLLKGIGVRTAVSIVIALGSLLGATFGFGVWVSKKFGI